MQIVILLWSQSLSFCLYTNIKILHMPHMYLTKCSSKMVLTSWTSLCINWDIQIPSGNVLKLTSLGLFTNFVNLLTAKQITGLVQQETENRAHLSWIQNITNQILSLFLSFVHLLMESLSQWGQKNGREKLLILKGCFAVF